MTPPPYTLIMVFAALYVLSGVCQPLIMTLCKNAGLADPTAQLYMAFYYAGPAFLIFTAESPWPPMHIIYKAMGICAFDITAQAMNYTGASLAGPTIFAIVYSSVTVWTAVFSRIFLRRSLSWWQWFSVVAVFGGLALTAVDSINLGPDVTYGTVLILVGSCAHAICYVMSEAVMTGDEHLTVKQNAGVQGLVACFGLVLWQVIYTMPRYDEIIKQPMEEAGTGLGLAAVIMLSFALSNLLHSYSFYHTLKHYPGGATSAGVMKGLQAVLVFVASHLLYCGRIGGSEMCFTFTKFISLVTVAGGVTLFGVLTELREGRVKEGYTRVGSQEEEEEMVVEVV